MFWIKREYPNGKESMLTELQKRILALLKTGNKLSHREIAERIGISKEAVRSNILKLGDMELICEERSGKTHYCSLKRSD